MVIIFDAGQYALRVQLDQELLYDERSLAVRCRENGQMRFGCDALATIAERPLFSVPPAGDVRMLYALTPEQQLQQLQAAVWKLRLDLVDCVALLFHSPLARVAELCEFFFSQCAESVVLIPSALATLAAIGELTGCVAAVHGEKTQTTCVLDGNIFSHTQIVIPGLGFRHVTERLLLHLETKKGYRIPAFYRSVLTDFLLRSFCFVSPRPVRDGETSRRCEAQCLAVNTNVVLPDGTAVVLDEERCEPLELLFDATNGLQISAAQSMAELDIFQRSQVQNNFVVAGGLTMLPGFYSRLKSEQSDTSARARLHLCGNQDGEHMLGCFQLYSVMEAGDCNQCVCRHDVEEHGLLRCLKNLVWFKS